MPWPRSTPADWITCCGRTCSPTPGTGGPWPAPRRRRQPGCIGGPARRRTWPAWSAIRWAATASDAGATIRTSGRTTPRRGASRRDPQRRPRPRSGPVRAQRPVVRSSACRPPPRPRSAAWHRRGGRRALVLGGGGVGGARPLGRPPPRRRQPPSSRRRLPPPSSGPSAAAPSTGELVNLDFARTSLDVATIEALHGSSRYSTDFPSFGPNQTRCFWSGRDAGYVELELFRQESLSGYSFGEGCSVTSIDGVGEEAAFVECSDPVAPDLDAGLRTGSHRERQCRSACESAGA